MRPIHELAFPILLLFGGLVVITTIACVVCGYYNSYFLNAGQLIVFALTLLVLIKYAIDTNRIANTNQERWEQELVPKVGYEIKEISSEKKRAGILFRLTNFSSYLTHAYVNCNFKIYGEKIDWPSAYDGTEFWELFPFQQSQGVFKIDEVVSKKGKTLEQMVQECDPTNKSSQLTMELELIYENAETGRRRELPPRKHYFDFERWRWIPFITKPAE